MVLVHALVAAAALIDVVSDGKDTGTCGPTCNWVYDDKKLKITGEEGVDPEPMDTFNWSYPVPWKEFEHKIRTIKVRGVSTISKGVFQGCEVVETVEIADVVSIESDAFNGLTTLTSVTFSDDKLEEIGAYAFQGCSSLETFAIPKSVTTIKNTAFRWLTGLKSFSVPEDSESFEVDENGALYNKGKTSLYFFPPASDTTVFEIPETVTTVEYYAFQKCSKLTSLTLPVNLFGLGFSETSLAGCTGLNTIAVADGNTAFTIVEGALTSGSTLIKYPAKRDGDSFVIPESLTRISSYAFEGASKLKTIEIHKNVNDLSNYGDVFNGCTGLEEFIVDPENTLLQAVDGVLFKNYSNHNYLFKYPAQKQDVTYVVPFNTTYIIGYAFDSVTELATVVFEAPVETIGIEAFVSCHNLSSIVYPFEKNPGSSASIVDCPKLEQFCKTEDYKDTLFLGMRAVDCDASSVVIPSVLVMVVMAIFARFF